MSPYRLFTIISLTADHHQDKDPGDETLADSYHPVSRASLAAQRGFRAQSLGIEPHKADLLYRVTDIT